MAVEDFDKYMELAKVLNNSWGTGSQLRSPSQSIKFTLRDDQLMKCSFIMIVNMPADPKLAFEMKNRYKSEGLQMIKGSIDSLIERYKEQTGKTLRLKLQDRSVLEGVEYLTNAQYRMNKHAYFRLDCLIEVQ